ncbi:hypothetical protein GLOIN_2v1482617 [Rhizophagus irregularis DAOM 181602=DAOM 197198]|nr:hypothetical protein GLOIN_2v1482617 [Rhizophagus irregularis DAOM 181602=DAOM 197198]
MQYFQKLNNNKSLLILNITLKTNSNCKLIQLLKEFIAIKHERSTEVGDDNNLEEINDIKRAVQNTNIISLQKDLINQIIDSSIIKIWKITFKRRLKSMLELLKRKILI